VLDGEMLGACERVMRGLCAEMGAELREFSGGHDHVHLLVQYPPKLAVSTLVNRLKAVSAHYLRTEYTSHISPHLVHGHLWSPSYLAVSAGDAPLTAIRQYTDNHNQLDQHHPESPTPNGQNSPEYVEPSAPPGAYLLRDVSFKTADPDGATRCGEQCDLAPPTTRS